MALRGSHSGSRRFGRSTGSGGSGSGQAAVAGFAAGVLACTLVVLTIRHREAVAITAANTHALPGTLPPPLPPAISGASSGSSTAEGSGSSKGGNGEAGPSGGGGAAAAATAAAAQQQQEQQKEQQEKEEQEKRKQQQQEETRKAQGRGEIGLDLDSLPHLFISFGNAAYFPFVHNWARSVQAIGAPYVIAAFDDPMLDLCVKEGLRCISAKFASAKYFRGDFAAFRAMGAHKVRLVLRLLEEHPSLPLVVVADSDTVWLREPWTYFEQRPTAEFFISSDCLSHEMEDRWQPGNSKLACGHIPGNAGVAFNTGLFATRNTNASRAFLAAWADMLTDKDKERDKNRGVDDQLALNLLFEEGVLAGLGKDDPRTILAWNRQLRVQVLPVVLFAGGHVAFVQQTPWKQGIEPISVHMTFQRWWEAGKISRLREYGLWHIDPPGYYGANTTPGITTRPTGNAAAPYFVLDTSSHFLTYQNGVLEWMEGVERARGGPGSVLLFEKNWLGLAYQLAAFRDALAMGRMLGRAVVLPPMYCWCDYDEAPPILETCINPNADMQAPFRCPPDFLGPLHILDEHSRYVQWRNPGFLDLPQVPATVRHSRARVDIAASKPDPPFPNPAHMAGHAVTIWPGIKQGELLQAVKPIKSVAVLEFRGPMPGLIAGFDSPEYNAQFDKFWNLFLLDAKWCCTTWGTADEEYRAIPLAHTPELSAPWQPWVAPILWAPDWCDKVSNTNGNRDFTKLTHHPCKFAPRRGSNATAAAAAAKTTTQPAGTAGS